MKVVKTKAELDKERRRLGSNRRRRRFLGDGSFNHPRALGVFKAVSM